MAITINSVPADFASLHDDLWFVVSSDNVSEESFKYVYDVWIDGTLISRQKGVPRPTGENSYGIYNPAPIIRNYMTNYFTPSGASVLMASNDNIKIDYVVKFGEEVSGVLTSDLVSGAYEAYNFYQPMFGDGILSLGNGGDLNLSDQYDNLQISNWFDDWLTERDTSNVVVDFGQKIFITFMNSVFGDAVLQVQLLSDGGAAQGSPVSGGLLSMGTNKFNLLNIAAANINELLETELITSAQWGYKVRLLQDGGSGYTNWITVKHGCYPKTNPANVHFLNRLGGWDSFAFNLVNRHSMEVERRSFRRSPWQLNSDTMQQYDSYNRFNEANIQFSTRHVDKYKLTSDYIREEDWQWLGQLVASPIVYIEVNGAYFPVIVTDTNYDFKIDGADGLFNLELNIQIAKYNNSQYR